MDLFGDEWEAPSARCGGDSLSAGTGGPNGGVAPEITREAAASGEEEVFVALPEQHKNGKSTLAWALRNVGDMVHPTDSGAAAAAAGVVVVHVHAPAQMIPLMGSKFHASKLSPGQVRAYRQHERKKVDKHLDEYIRQCAKMNVKGTKIVIENQDVPKGITELISLLNVTKLVMGAAADKHYSRKMKMPKSKTAIQVMDKADPSCKIWFVCKDHLISTREAGAIRNPVQTIQTVSKWGGLPNRCTSSAFAGRILRSISEKVAPTVSRTSRQPSQANIEKTLRKLSMEDISVVSWDSVPRESFPCSFLDEGLSDSSSLPKDDVIAFVPSTLRKSGFPNPAQCHQKGHMDSRADLFGELRKASSDGDKNHIQAFDESLKTQKTEEELISHHEKAKESEDMYIHESKKTKEVEKVLAKANEDILLLKEEIEVLKQDRNDIISKFSEVSEQKADLEQQVTEYVGVVNELEDMVDASRSLVDSQKMEIEQLKLERDNVLKDAEELRREKENILSGLNVPCNTEFPLLELQQATRNFCDKMKVGEGGFGCVYKGLLRNTTVAVKVLRSQDLQGQSQFQQEVAVLSRVRHPNLVTLIGSCSEASALVYEFLQNGSLEDRLVCENNTPPLTWQVRTRIIGEICSALVFLHSNKPHPVIHGDLKPGNILLDANLVSKLSDFGISCLLTDSSKMSSSFYQTTNARGTFPYMDPEFLTTGELTARSDIYSFGIVVLRLVTGKPALGIARLVEDALEKGEMELLVDQSGGEWPFAQAEKLMLLGLQCAELSRRRRPDRMNLVWRVVEPLVKSALDAAEPLGHRFTENHIPLYFICPISQEIMRNPQIAADGFTYEAKAIKGWLDSGHNTSPMTKIVLAHRHLTPNHALRSAIEEYMQQMQQLKTPLQLVGST